MKTVELSQSYTGHESVLNKVAFREPVFNDIMALGEPEAEGLMAGGVYIRNINYEVVQGYAERLVQAPFNGLLLGQLNVKDTKAVVGAILGFFREAPSNPEPAISSSPSDGTQPPSAT
jgi:hypothetical protein